MLRIFILWFFIIFLPFSHAVTLSQKWVLKKVLENSLEYQKIQSQKKALNTITSESLAFLDWNMFLESKLKKQIHTPLQFFETPQKEEFIISSGLQKKILTGTVFKIQYNYIQEDKEFTDQFKKISSTPTATWRDSVSLNLEQDLWRNFFGVEDRLKLKIATARQSIESIKLEEGTEALLLEALEQFWTAYVSFVSLNAKQSKQRDYAQLLSIIRKKSRYGKTRPGHLNQIQAEWEQAKQDWILQKRNYEDDLDKLLDLLNIQKNSSFTFKIEKKVLPPPKFKIDPLFEERKVLLAKQSLLIQRYQKDIQKSLSNPTLQLLGSYTVGGYNTDRDSSFKDLIDSKNRNYFIGLNFRYPFSATEERRKKIDYYTAKVDASELDLKIRKKEFQQMVDSSRKGVLTLYQILLSTKRIHFLRKKSYREIRKAFLDGRLSVFDLIRAKELSLFAEIAKAQWKAKYYQTLAYTYAIQDQLTDLYLKK